jgi:ribosomal protein S18 acetylase RimI-like enzyme
VTVTHVESVSRPTPEVLEAVRRLLPQLSLHSEPPDHAALACIVGSPDVQLLLAVDSARGYVGMLSLVLTPLPTGVRGRIEDVVVDVAARGEGAGRMLAREAVRLAREGGARDVDLTSRPERREAAVLYESLGFARRNTHVYRLAVRGSDPLEPP